jgi:CDP-diacylglycerol--glycerol-3-phosphate 3-phosphatidyltransferase
MEEDLLQKIRQSFDLRELAYPANILSLARLALVWPTVRYLIHPEAASKHRALACIAAGMATDAIDGRIARSRNEVSSVGKFLDPIADKLTLDAVAVALSMRRDFPWWATYLLLGRDAAILTGSTLIFRDSSYITTSVAAGKIATVALTATLLLYILDAQPWARRLLGLTLIPLVISWVQYGIRYYEWLAGRSTESGV